MEELFRIFLSLFVLLPGNRKISGLHTLVAIRMGAFQEQSANKNSYLHLWARNYLH